MLKHKGEHERETAEEHGVVQTSKVLDGGLKGLLPTLLRTHAREGDVSGYGNGKASVGSGTPVLLIDMEASF